jgi:ribose 5-phosphate isomerase A
MSNEALKKIAAEKAVERIQSGMVLGLGSGSTVAYALRKIGELWQSGALTDIVGIPTSKSTAVLAEAYDIPLSNLTDHPQLDLAIDGADEVDPGLDLIKGLGGALLREKMVELTAAYFIVVIDESKCVQKLGTKGPLPVEVTQFGWQHQARWLAETVKCVPVLREDKCDPFITDNGNYILDCTFPRGIDDLTGLATSLRDRTGVVEHGLFLGMANEVIVAAEQGIQVRKR